MTPFQRGKALKHAFERRHKPCPAAEEASETSSARIWRFRQKPAETRRRADGTELTGRFSQDRLNGWGLMLFPDGRRYEGDFEEGVRQGRGTMTYPSGAVYSGHFRNNRRHGRGVMTFAGGFRYEGLFRENRCHGYGSLYFPDGTTYHGQFENGRFNGRGDLTFPDGSRYEGGFREDRRHGRGTMTFPSGLRYEGLFRENRPDGYGRLTYPGGTRYVGQLRAGQCHGHGELVYADGTRYRGQFKAGRYHGRGRLTYPDGTVHEGEFDNDRPAGADDIPGECFFPLDMDLTDCRLREDEPEKKADGPSVPAGPGPEEDIGCRHRTSDGHYVTSKEEIIVDNWLYMAGVRHVHRKRLPVAETVYATFYLPEGRVCLEYRRQDDGAEAHERQRRIFKDNEFNLIEIRDEDFRDLDDILSQKLLSCGIRAF